MSGTNVAIPVEEILVLHLKYVNQMIDVNLTTMDLIFVVIIFLITGHLTRLGIMSVTMNIGGIVIVVAQLVIKVHMHINLIGYPIRVPINYPVGYV